jgi:hypothetical protein
MEKIILPGSLGMLWLQWLLTMTRSEYNTETLDGLPQCTMKEFEITQQWPGIRTIIFLLENIYWWILPFQININSTCL